MSMMTDLKHASTVPGREFKGMDEGQVMRGENNRGNKTSYSFVKCNGGLTEGTVV